MTNQIANQLIICTFVRTTIRYENFATSHINLCFVLHVADDAGTGGGC